MGPPKKGDGKKGNAAALQGVKTEERRQWLKYANATGIGGASSTSKS
jgi:hypothetical protein